MKKTKKVELSKIQWTSVTWDPCLGCRKVIDGCEFCYNLRDEEQYRQRPTDVLKSKNKV
jgi:protein gp37